VTAIRPGALSAEVVTDDATLTADVVVVAAGAWLPSLLPLPAARVCRQVQFWFEPDGPAEVFAPERMPVFIHARGEMFYGFPAVDGGLKIAGEQFERAVAPDDMETVVTDEESCAMHALASPHLRITARCLRAVACKYTVLPEFRFAIDHHPDTDRVWFASACSGHGFKHSAAVGEALAEMAAQGKTRFDLSAFRVDGPPR
jgi:sarcosine oxidase